MHNIPQFLGNQSHTRMVALPRTSIDSNNSVVQVPLEPIPTGQSVIPLTTSTSRYFLRPRRITKKQNSFITPGSYESDSQSSATPLTSVALAAECTLDTGAIFNHGGLMYTVGSAAAPYLIPAYPIGCNSISVNGNHSVYNSTTHNMISNPFLAPQQLSTHLENYQTNISMHTARTQPTSRQSKPRLQLKQKKSTILTMDVPTKRVVVSKTTTSKKQHDNSGLPKQQSKRQKLKTQDVDDADGHLCIRIYDYITPRFQILKLLGQGTFGKVVEAFDKHQNKRVAIKIIKAIPKYREAAKIELNVLELIELHDPGNSKRCIHLRETFEFHNHICMVFDLLSQSLFDYFKANFFSPFSTLHIQSFAHQILVAAAYLHSLGITHTDLKPENLMLESTESRQILFERHSLKPPCRALINTGLMLIDFGSATLKQDFHSNIVSTRHYRAPEIILGVKWSYPCDVWSIGCILAELYIGKALFQTHDNLEHLRMMEIVLGKFPSSMVCRSPSANQFFNKQGFVKYPNTHTDSKSIEFVSLVRPLTSIINGSDELSQKLLDLLQKMLAIDPNTRISAKNALHHPLFADISI
ncbi:serine threonine protein kinase CMGC group [Batrachochytrium dendrobatidis]